MNTPNDDYDNPWKMAADRYFREFLAIFYPELEAAIDWHMEPTFHDQELRQVTHDAKIGLRRLDKLAKVQLLDGGELYIHIEVQLSRQRGFGRRMFTYNSRLFDRYGCAVASIAVLADRSPDWRPQDFWCEAWGTTLGMTFTAVKLLDFLLGWDGQEGNFFAWVTQAHFATMLTRRSPDRRLSKKILLTRMAYAMGWPKRRILDFLDVLDWLMQLPASQKVAFEAALSELERRLNMPYVNSMVRDAIAKGLAQGVERGIEQGREQGIEQGIELGLLKGRREAILELLSMRFGPMPDVARLRIDRATKDEISRWMAKAILASSLEDVLEE